jgi:hypothetical protein
LPDNAEGAGVRGVLGLYVNGRKMEEVSVEIDASKGVYHVLFDGTVIERSQWEPVHVVGKLASVVFRGTVSDGRATELRE